MSARPSRAAPPADQRAGSPPPAPVVSVVIPTKGRPDLLDRCLAALGRQTLERSEYEVVVIDDGPDEETCDTVRRRDDHDDGGGHDRRERDDRHDVVYRYIPNTTGNHGPAAARNLGWRAARGRIVAFTDDDTVPEPEWLAAGTAAFTDGVAGVAGRLSMPIPARPTDYERDAARLAEAEFVTANCFYRREMLEEVGGFDERFRAAWREDSDLEFTLTERGHRLERAPEARVLHPVREAAWGVSLRQQQKSRFNALLYKKHPVLYRERFGASPRWYYAAVFAALGVAVSLLTGRRRWAAGLAGLWLGLTARFALRRLRGASRRPSHIAEMVVTSALIPPVSLYWRLRGSVRYRVWFW